MQIDPTTYRMTDKGSYANVALIIGIIGLVASAIGYFVDSRQFFFSWLTGFAFWVNDWGSVHLGVKDY